jgi:hypothetical protein
MERKLRVALQRSAMAVAVSKGRWLGIAEALRLEVLPDVHPTTWREAMLGRGWGRRPRKQCKRQAVEVVRALWKIKMLVSHDHTAEAIIIGAYAAKDKVVQRELFDAGARNE